jgi:hypothetical protein
MANENISTTRKILYYGGMFTAGVGILVFVSTFFTFFQMDSLDSGDPGFSFIGSFMARPFIGMGLLVIGNIMRSIGMKGTAGSGLILSPNKARQDYKPWTKMAGGMLKDAMDESKEDSSSQNSIKIRCRACKTLNEEDASFCKSCGQQI